MVVLTIARLTLREAARKKLLIAVAVLTVVVALLSGWAFHRLLYLPCGTPGHEHRCDPATLKVVAATLLILLMFMFSFVLALGAAFIAAPTVWSDVETGIMLAVLPRPIRRSDIILGKWLGLAALIGGFIAVCCGMEFVIARIALSYVPPHPVLAIVFIILEAWIVLTLSLTGSTRLAPMTGGIIVVVLFGLTWMGGIAGAVGASFHTQAIENIGTVSSLILPTDGLWRAAIYQLEPAASIIAAANGGRSESANPFLVTNGPTVAYVAWAIAWGIAALAAGVWSFRRKEL